VERCAPSAHERLIAPGYERTEKFVCDALLVRRRPVKGSDEDFDNLWPLHEVAPSIIDDDAAVPKSFD
jgi:hypothetical protein